MGKGKSRRAVDDPGQDCGTLRVAAGQTQSRAAQHDAGEIGFGRHRPAQRLHHHLRVDRPAAEAPVAFGKGQAEEAKLGQFGPAAVREALGRLAGGDELLQRAVAIAGPTSGGLLQEDLLVGKIKVHDSRSSKAEDRLGDHIVLDFVGAAVDRHLAVVEIGRRGGVGPGHEGLHVVVDAAIRTGGQRIGAGQLKQ